MALHNHNFDPYGWKMMDTGRPEGDFPDYFASIFWKAEHQTFPHPHDTYVIDVGAHVGFYTLLSARMQQNVIVFEPNPTNLLRLCDSLLLNNELSRDEEIDRQHRTALNSGGGGGGGGGGDHGLEEDDIGKDTRLVDVHLFQQAVSNEHGMEQTVHSPRNPSQPFLQPTQPDDVPGLRKAKTTTVQLDVFAQEQGWFDRPTTTLQISVLKVSIDGKEPFVVEGATKLLQSGLVRNVLVAGRKFSRPNMRDMFVKLMNWGFELKGPRIRFNSTDTEERAFSLCQYYVLKPNQRTLRHLWFQKMR